LALQIRSINLAAMSDTPLLAIERVAALTGVAVADIERLIATGILSEADLTTGNLTGIRFLLTLEAGGVSLDVVSEALMAGDLAPGFWANLVLTPALLSGRSFGEVLEALDIPMSSGSRFLAAMGLPPPQVDRIAREDEVRLLEIFAALSKFELEEGAVVDIARVFGQATRTLSAAMRDLFRSQIETLLLKRGVPLTHLMAAAGEVRGPLQRLGLEAADILLRRGLEEVIFENVVLRTEEALASSGRIAPPQRYPAVAFADIVGFTTLSREIGDERASGIARSFEALAVETVPMFNGRLVKSLGDGVLIYFRDASDAAPALAEITRRLANREAPPFRIGVAAGPVLLRDGDIFGATVIRASRLAGVARAGEILGDKAMASLDTSQIPVVWHSQGMVSPKGLPAMEVYRLA
jgi:adenylate cyclase